MQIRYKERPKAIKYADQIARERRAKGLLFSTRSLSLYENVALELRHRARGSLDRERALVRWLIECNCIPRWISGFDDAIADLRLCPARLLGQLAQALQVQS